MSEENKILVRRWFEEVWNKGCAEVIDEMFAPDCLAHGLTDELGNTLCGAAPFKAFHRKFLNAFPDMKVIVEDVIAEGDKVVARCTVRATHTGDALGFAPSNKPIEITGVSISR